MMMQQECPKSKNSEALSGPSRLTLNKTEQQYDNLTFDGSSIGETVVRKKKKRTIYLIGAGLLIVTVALALGLGIGLGNRSDKPTQTGSTEKQDGGQGYSTAKTTTTKSPSTTNKPVNTTTTYHATTTEHVDWLSQPCTNQESPPSCPWSSSENPLLLVSLDGFKAEYILRNLTPVIQKLRTCGIHTPYMRAAYPTLTFPNHYTIVTGLYPESNGIVGNSMYDPYLNESFRIGSSTSFNPHWWEGEPLWITAKKQGKRAASYFWVGSDVNISGIYPDIWYKYNGKVSYEERVDTVIGWLLMNETERPDFMTLYFNEPDHQGHGTGPDSPEVDKMLGKVDDIIKRLMNGLLRHKLDHCVNLIILADHGMAPTSCERQVDLNKYMHDVNKMLIYDGTTGHINPHFYKHSSVVVRNDNPMSTDDIISHLQCKNSHLNVFTRATIPKRHHYTNSDRIGDVMMDVESSWLVYDKKSSSCLDGNHGYDNIYKSMHALFLAHGPDFKQGLDVKPFENIELYNLMSDLLHIEPVPNNGTTGALDHFLRSPRNSSTLSGDYTYSVCESANRERNSTCACSQMTGTDRSLNRTSMHFQAGDPMLAVNRSSCLLPGHQFSTLFDNSYKMPVLTSYTLEAERVANYEEDNTTCVMTDPRLSDEDNPDCVEYQNVAAGIEMAHLYDAGLAQNETEKSEALLSSNVVPMYRGFRAGIWSYLWRAIKEYTALYKQVSVTIGPAFDYRPDGLWETLNNSTRYVSNSSSVPLPTHFYITLMKCRNNSSPVNMCLEDDLDILSFILPHQPKTHNCIPNKDFLLNNVARIKDIEELTGIRFMTRFDIAAGARLRTFLPLTLWDSPVVTPWNELPCTSTTDHCPSGRPPVLLISLDGFRADYLKRHLTPTIERLSKCGVHTPYMRSVFPTVTFPNHYSIVTGLYPESHGIVYNTMFDEKIGQIFSISKSISKDPRWWKGEPIWITAKKHGLKTATYFWPGSDVNITGVYPDIWKHYDGTAGYTERVYEVLKWIDMPAETRPDFMTLYFDEPDHAGHSYGPESDGVDGQLETVDELIDILMTNLYERNLQNCINIIIIADHGFDDISCEKTVEISDFYKDITKMYMIERVFGQVFPQFKKVNSSTAIKNTQEFSPQEISSELNCKHPAMRVFTKDTLPKRHHFTNNDRIAPLLLDMETEWMVFDDRSYYCSGGNHGWDNTYKSMHALFLAHGPSFKQNYTTKPFENIELYNMMTELLDIEPAPNNGTPGSMSHILLDPKPPTPVNVETSAICNSSDDFVTPLCGCDNYNVTNIQVSSKNSSSVINRTLVFGIPMAINDSLCILTDERSAWGYSSLFNASLWLSSLADNTTVQNNTDEACIVSDPRINGQKINCSASANDNFTYQSLSLSGISSFQDAAVLSSTVIPMYKGFYTDIWKYFNKLVQDYVSLYGTLSITTGAIFDYNNDGLWEGIQNETRYTSDVDGIPVPSDIYIILAKCKITTEELPCESGIDLMSFILPHLEEVPNCMSHKDYLRDNVARIRDIELLTGLQFMTFKSNESVQLRTFLAEQLWGSSLFRTWTDTPCSQQEQCNLEYRPLLLLSLSGFRADYLQRNVTPNLKRLSECGISAPYMRGVFPTTTFPNQYTIVTGLYPESHGIIDNRFYDAKIGKPFYSNNRDSVKDSRFWDAVEPIWARAKRQGLKTATSLWPGSYANISGINPDIWKDFGERVSHIGQVNEILSWLSLPETDRPHLIAAVMDEPGKTGLNVGPSNENEINTALRQVDSAIGRLMEGLYEKGLHNCVNIVIVSDHGMADVNCKRLQRLRNYVDLDYLSSNFYVWDGAVGRISNTYVYNSTVKGILPSSDNTSFNDIMKNISCRVPHLRPYKKQQLPVRLHYFNNNRIDDVILDMDTEWMVTRSWISDCRGGDSGWDNKDQQMQAIFLAHGPAFKRNLTVEPFENIELYNMFSSILNITSAPNNGTFGSLNHLLRIPPDMSRANNSIDYNYPQLSITSVADLTSFIESSNCSICERPSNTKLQELLDVLTATAEPQHTPWGLPSLGNDWSQNRTVDILYQPSFTTAFDTRLKLPIWLSQTLNYSKMAYPQNQTGCVYPDPRINIDDENCQLRDDDSWLSLLHQENITSETGLSDSYTLTSTLVPALNSFATGIWLELQNIISDWLKKYDVINVVTGPVFDHNSDGLADSSESLQRLSQNNTWLNPSHFFAIVTRCNNEYLEQDKCRDVKISAFVIPHLPNSTNCMTIKDFLSKNEARVKDVELITGLQFYTSLNENDRVKIKTSFPIGLWS